MRGITLLAAVGASASAGLAELVASGVMAVDGSDPLSTATQGGVFALAIAVAYYFIKRGDSREQALHIQAQADLKALRDEMALLRAEIMQKTDKLIESLADNARLHQQIDDLRRRRGE